MAFHNLPVPIAAFLGAVEERDAAALVAIFSADAGLVDLAQAYGPGQISDWIERMLGQAGLKLHPINLARRDGKIVLSCMVERSATGVADRRQLDWHFVLAGGKIAALDIVEEPGPYLPPPIDAFVRAVNNFDLEGLVALFADDALVNDQLHDYWGKAAIRDWAREDIIGDKFTMFVVKAVKHYENYIVTAHADGEYDKKGLPHPLTLSFYFSSSGEQIVQLIILNNQRFE
jgi:ketosteroid isomerase-like protein